MNRLRFGKHTDDDIALLNTRVRTSFPEDAFHIFGDNHGATELNESRLQGLTGDIVTSMAINYHPHRQNFKPEVDKKNGCVKGTQFKQEFKLKKNARVMHTFNVATADGLTNGARGTVVDFTYSKDGSVKEVLVKFDDETVGEDTRKRLGRKDGLTPVGRVSFEYNLNKHSVKVKVTQFPLMLAWAVTAHKFQGATIKKPKTMVLHLDNVWACGQAYVMLGRIQSLDQLYLASPVNPAKIIVNDKAAKMSQHITEVALNNQPSIWKDKPNGEVNICTLNARSLIKHHEDLICDSVLMQSDIICVNETFITSPDTRNIDIPGFKLYVCGNGRGNRRGVAVYARNSHRPATVLLIGNRVDKHYQILRLEYPLIDIIAIYISPSISSMAAVIDEMSELIKPNRATIICGDVNCDPVSILYIHYIFLTMMQFVHLFKGW